MASDFEFPHTEHDVGVLHWAQSAMLHGVHTPEEAP
jgi:hypothetical protein